MMTQFQTWDIQLHDVHLFLQTGGGDVAFKD